MPISYGVQGPSLDQYGGDTQYASPVVGQEEGIPIGGTGAGFLPSQEELRRKALQEKNRGENLLMAQELQKILGGMAVPANYGLDAGMSMGGGAGRPLDFMSAINQQNSQFGGTMPNAMPTSMGFGKGGAPFGGFEGLGDDGFSSLNSSLDNMINMLA